MEGIQPPTRSTSSVEHPSKSNHKQPMPSTPERVTEVITTRTNSSDLHQVRKERNQSPGQSKPLVNVE